MRKFLSLIAAVCCALLLSQTVYAEKTNVTVNKGTYKGWKNNLFLSNGDVELIVTLDVGPRVISYRLKGGKNVFKQYADQLGKSGEESWQIRGGHRLWTAPERIKETYYPDNAPVKSVVEQPGLVRFIPPKETSTGLQKEIVLRLAKSGSKVVVEHRITNLGSKKVKLAPWALSVMAPGGIEIVPLPPHKPHPGGAKNATSDEDYWPNLNLVLWSYTDFRDPRLTLGSKYILLKQDKSAKGPIKFGLLNAMGWVGYLNDGTLFVKRFPYKKGATYPDRGCNYETFTNADMLELETLGPLRTLKPKQTVTLTETWQLFDKVPAVKTEQDVDKHVLPKIK